MAPRHSASSRRVIFNHTSRGRRKKPLSPPPPAASSINGEGRIRSKMAFPSVQSAAPELFTSLPPLSDELETESSKAQDAVVKRCIPYQAASSDSSRSPFDFNEFGVPKLERTDHAIFLHDGLGDLPQEFTAADPSRPWMLYWALTGLHLLGEDISTYREQYVSPEIFDMMVFTCFCT